MHAQPLLHKGGPVFLLSSHTSLNFACHLSLGLGAQVPSSDDQFYFPFRPGLFLTAMLSLCDPIPNVMSAYAFVMSDLFIFHPRSTHGSLPPSASPHQP